MKSALCVDLWEGIYWTDVVQCGEKCFVCWSVGRNLLDRYGTVWWKVLCVLVCGKAFTGQIWYSVVKRALCVDLWEGIYLTDMVQCGEKCFVCWSAGRHLLDRYGTAWWKVLCVLVCGKEFTGQIWYSVVKSALCVGLWEEIYWTDMVQCGENCFVCWSVGRNLLDRYGTVWWKVLCVLVCGKEFTGQIWYSVVKSALCVDLWEGIYWTDMVQCGEKCFVCWSAGRNFLDRYGKVWWKVLCVLVSGKEFTGQIWYSVVKSALCVGLWERIYWTDMVQCGEKCFVCWSVGRNLLDRFGTVWWKVLCVLVCGKAFTGQIWYSVVKSALYVGLWEGIYWTDMAECGEKCLVCWSVGRHLLDRSVWRDMWDCTVVRNLSTVIVVRVSL